VAGAAATIVGWPKVLRPTGLEFGCPFATIGDVQDHQHRVEPPPATFPVAGFRARRWQRFERDLHAWLETPEGRFASWRAVQAIVADGDDGR